MAICRKCELGRWGETPTDFTPELFIEESDWNIAKTMLWSPHQYTVRDLWNDPPRKSTCRSHQEFEWFCGYIVKEGVPKRWGNKPPKPYLTVGEWEYWFMAPPIDFNGIINRQPVGPHAQAEMDLQVAAVKAAKSR